MNHISLAGAVVAGLLPLAAQNPAQWGARPPVFPPIANPIYGRAVVAHLTGHQVLDLVTLANGTVDGLPAQTAVLAGAPGVHRSACLLPGVGGLLVRDVAVVVGGDPARGRDALALVTDQGLYRWTAGAALVRFGGPNWNNASRVVVGDVDGDGVQDAIGVMGNGQNIRYQALGHGQSTWFIDTGATIQDLLVVDWCSNQGGDRDEIVLAQPDRIVFWVDGRIDHSRTLSQLYGQKQLLCFGDGAGGTRLAVVFENSGTWQLATFASNGSAPTCCALRGPVAGMTLVDHATGPDGLVLTWVDGANPTELRFDGELGALGFGVGTSLELSTGSQPGSLRVHRVDIEGDLDHDTVWLSDDAGLCVARTAGGVDAVPVAGQGPDFTIYVIGAQSHAWANGVEVLYLQMHRVVSGEVLTALALDPQVRHREVVGLHSNAWFPGEVSSATGPVITLLRYVETVNGTIVRRGGLRPVIWAEDAAERAMLLQGLTLVNNQEGGIGNTIEPPDVPPPPPDDPPEGGDDTGG